MPEGEKKITVILSNDLHRRVKVKAVIEDIRLATLIRKLLEEWASDSDKKTDKKRHISN